MKETALVIMAAGIGSRYGKGIKQLEKVGPSEELIMDYSVQDALEAGFNKVVFIIRKDIEQEFHECIGWRMAQKTKVEYVFQELDALPEGFTNAYGRTKPWGTGQAVLAVKDKVDMPFCVINADEFYGREPFVALHDYLVKDHEVKDGVQPICMAGYRMENTLSDKGGVTRGICSIDAAGRLTGIDETKNIIKTPEGAAVQEKDGSLRPLAPGLTVSMNMWGFQNSFISLLEEGFKEFLEKLPAGDTDSEYLLPIYVDQLISEGRAFVEVIPTTENWFGVTYHEDKDLVVSEIRKLVAAGVYKDNLYA